MLFFLLCCLYQERRGMWFHWTTLALVSPFISAAVYFFINKVLKSDECADSCFLIFPQRPTLHWIRGRGDTLSMTPQTLYRCFTSLLHSLSCCLYWTNPHRYLTFNLSVADTYLTFTSFPPSFSSLVVSQRGVYGGRKGSLPLLDSYDG